MSGLRRILFALFLALAVVAGQQAVALHDLSHLAGHKQDSTPGKTACDKCFACAELSSAVGASIPPAALPDGAPQRHEVHYATAAYSSRFFAFRSRAPPERS